MTETPPVAEYWYPDDHDARAAEVLELLRRYRAAEASMRARTRASMRMNETDLLALRMLLAASRSGELVRQRDIADALGISSASVTALVDRLEASGHLERRAHPTDRRSVALVATASSDDEVRRTLGVMHRRMLAVVDDMTADELEAVASFLGRMRVAVEGAAPDEDDRGTPATERAADRERTEPRPIPSEHEPARPARRREPAERVEA